MQAADAQLQVQAQWNQAVQMDNTDAIRTLAQSAQQIDFDIIFASNAVFGVTKKGNILSGSKGYSPDKILFMKHWEKRMWHKNLAYGLPMTFMWSSVRQELKRCFSNLLTSALVTVSLNTSMQTPMSLCIYMYHIAVRSTMQLPIRLSMRTQIIQWFTISWLV